MNLELNMPKYDGTFVWTLITNVDEFKSTKIDITREIVKSVLRPNTHYTKVHEFLGFCINFWGFWGFGIILQPR